MIVFAAHEVLCQNDDDDGLGYLLLRCTRAYLVVDMYAALEVHTSETLKKGRAAVAEFGKLLQVSYFLNILTV